MQASPDRFKPRVRKILENREYELWLSAASSWELAIKYRLGKLALPSPISDYVSSRLARDGVRSLEVSHTHALRVAHLPQHHRDPFDRLLIAQAQAESLTLLTSDSQLFVYEVDILEA